MQGQQLDIETGFYNRYRYYGPRMGRYATLDPIKSKGGINGYSYADANLSRYVDSLGLFTSDQHIAITIEALWACSGLTPEQLKKLAWASAADDWTPTWKDSQAVSNAPWHAMARPGQDAAKAAAETGTFIQEQMSIGSTESVGRAIHAAQDAAAGGHVGSQVYNGEFDLKHFLNDLFPSKDEREKAIAATRKLFPKCQNMCFK